MKNYLVGMTTALILVFGMALAKAPDSMLLAQNLIEADTAKIAQVGSGQIKTAKASWWGFDKQDSTKFLQEAIRSKVPTLIVDNPGSPWVVGGIVRLVSNQTIIFEDGVVIEAMKGKFHSRNTSLISGVDVENVIMEGRGKVTLRMQKDDYANPDLYEHAEWRHGLTFRGASNVTLRNFTITKTGGDGLYLAGSPKKDYCENFLIEEMDFDDNYRQGISIISAQNLTIRRSRFTSTSGTNPQAGIDFEPNKQTERLVNCVIEDCIFYDNVGSGLTIYTPQLDDKQTLPVSITINNCKFRNNSNGFTLTPARPAKFTKNTPITGNVTLNNCVFESQNIAVRDMVDGSIVLTLNNTTLDYRQATKLKRQDPDVKHRVYPFYPTSNEIAPFTFSTGSGVKDPLLGGVVFDKFTIYADSKVEPIQTRFDVKSTLSNNIKGTIHVNVAGKETSYDVQNYVQQERERLQKFEPLESFLTRRTANIPQLRSKEAPVIDGKLEEELYKQYAWLEPFIGYVSRAGFPELEAQTRVFAAYDNENLYIAFNCDEPIMKRQLVAGTLPDDSIHKGENLDWSILKGEEFSNRAKTQFYHFILNPNNVRWDAINTGASADLKYNPDWKSATSKTDKGWTAEIAIPWKEIGIQNIRSGLKLRANFARKRSAGEIENSSWSQYVGGFQEPENFGILILN